MSEDTPPVQDPDTEMADVEPEIDQEELVHQKRLELLRSLDTTPTYNWGFLTDDLKDNFETREESLVLDAIASPETIDGLFYEVIHSAKYFTSDRLSIDQLSTILNDIFDKKVTDEFPYKFISIFNTFKTDDNLIQLLKSLHRLPSKDLATYLVDDQLVIKLNVIKDYQKNKTEYLLSNFVEQKKYNMISESSEGYAKVMILLHDVIDSDDSVFQVDYTVNAVERLIGHFSLDPTRVLDVIIDIFIGSILINYRFCIDFLKRSRWWPQCEADISSLKTLDKGGNKEAAILFGQKLRNYANRDHPETMKLLIAILIKERFISFGDLLKYFGPDDKGMKVLEEKVDKEIDDQIFKASASALALSGPLVDDEADGAKDDSKTKSTSKSETKELSETELRLWNQKLQITKALLTTGVYWPSIYLLTKYPFIVHADSEIVPLILRLFRKMIEPLKDQIRVLNPQELMELKSEKQTALSRKTAANDALEFEEFQYNVIEVFRPLQNNHTNKKFIFFYHEWSSDLPIVDDYEKLFKYSAELLSFAGAKIGEDPQLISLLSRFGVADLEGSKDDEDDYNKKLNLWFEYFRKYIFPASTVIFENSLTTHDIFDLLKQFPLQKRYNLYGDMVLNISKNNNVVRLNYSKAEKQTKDVLKRITTENVKPMMRRFAKISFANPIPSFLVIVTQVESYDNLSNLMVDAARYFTDYAWDVLPFVLLMRLTARRDFVQSDGLNEAPWLQSLATFIAKLGKSYSSMNLTPILTFIIKDLHKNNTIGLTILREIVNQMGGIQQSSNLSANQIKLLNSGESLQRSINKVIFDTREECAKPALRLLSHLINSNQLSELFILLSNFHRDLIEKSDDSAHYKVLSSQSDEITSVLHTFIELINYFLRNDSEIFKKNTIELAELITKYGVDSSWAFELWRRNVDSQTIDEIEFVNVDFETLNKNLHTTFWKLSLYDINYDESLYTHEGERLKEANTSIADQLDRLRRGRQNPEAGANESKLRKERSFNEDIINQIPKDNEAHKLHSEKILKEIEERRQGWFKKEDPSAEEIQSFYQYCVIPRAIHSETDAIFTGKFITSLFKTEVSMRFVDIFLSSEILDTLIYTITPLEAENLGFFLAEIFKFYEDLRNSEGLSNNIKETIYKWHTEALESIKLNIESENYMSRRNSFTLLKNLISVYPIVEDHAEQIVELIEKVSNSEERKDLKLASDAILAHIKSRSKKWIHLWDFYELPEEEKQQAIQKREIILKERENKKLEAKRAELLRQKAQRDAEIASRAQSRAESRPASRPESRASTRPQTGSDIRLRPRFQEVKDEDGDISMIEDIDKKDEPAVEAENTEESEQKDLNENEDDIEAGVQESDDTFSDAINEPTEKEKDTKEGKEQKRENDENNDQTKEKRNQRNNISTEKGEVKTSAESSEPTKTGETETESQNFKKQELEAEKPGFKEGKEEKEVEKRSSKGTDSYVPSPTPEKTEIAENERPKRVFRDVTAPASANQKALLEKLRKIQDSIEKGDFSKLRDAMEDEEYENKIIDASKRRDQFLQSLSSIMRSYLQKIITPNTPASVFMRRILSLINDFPVPAYPYQPRSESSSKRSRAPLPPQQSILGYANKPTEKWGLENRTMKQLPSGPAAQSSTPSRPYNQGYRQGVQTNSRLSQASGSARSQAPPPPPPPPPKDSRPASANSKRDYGSDNSNRSTRYNSAGQPGYRDKRPRRF